jgi:hypothetical protein
MVVTATSQISDTEGGILPRITGVKFIIRSFCSDGFNVEQQLNEFK